MTDYGSKDKKDARIAAIVLLVLGVMLLIGIIMAIPMIAGFVQTSLAPGLGVKSAAIIAFIVTVVMMIVFTIVAGDGLIGELQFMLGGFFSFFFIIWLLIAWVF